MLYYLVMKLRGWFGVIGDWVRRPEGVVFIAGLLLTTISMVLNYRHTAYSSDDVIWQNALLHWRPHSGDVFFGDKADPFILQMPLYWLVSLVIAPGRHAMLVDGLLLALINFVLVYAALLHFMRVLKVKASYVSLLPVLWLTASSYGLSRLFLETNAHTISVGLIFVLLMVVSKLCRSGLVGEGGRKRYLAYGVIILLVGLSAANDGYFVYFGVLPAIALTGLYLQKKFINTTRAAVIVGIIAAGYVVSAIITHLLPHIGIVPLTILGKPAFATFDNLGSYSMNAIHSFLVITGTNFFGQPLVGMATVVGFVNLWIAGLAVACAAKLLRHRPEPETTALAGLFWFIIIAFTISSLNMAVVQTYRYLVAAPFVMAVLLATLPSRQKLVKTRMLQLALIVAVVLNISASAFNVAPALASPIGEGDNQTLNYQLIATLQKSGAGKGYTEYWSSHVNTYLSGGAVNALPVKCVNGTTLPYVWLVDKKQYLELAHSSFYMFVDSTPLCTKAQVRQQFGAPVREKKVSGGTVWFYNYDILNKMDRAELK